MSNQFYFDGAISRADGTSLNSVTCTLPGSITGWESIVNISVPKFKEYKFPGAFFMITKNGSVAQVYIKEVIYSNPATVVFWNDGTKTVSRCHKSDTYSEETGLLMCIMKKLYSSSQVKDCIEFWMPSTSANPGVPSRVTLKEAIKKLEK